MPVDSAFLDGLNTYLDSGQNRTIEDYRLAVEAAIETVRSISDPYRKAVGSRILATSALPKPVMVIDIDGEVEVPPPDVMEAEFNSDFEEDEYDVNKKHHEDEITLSKGKTKRPILTALDNFFSDTRDIPLLTREQEIDCSKQIEDFGYMFRQGVLVPGYGTRSVAGLIHRCCSNPDGTLYRGRFPGLDVKKEVVLSKGPDAIEYAKKLIAGEREIIERLMTESLSDRTSARLRNEMTQMQCFSRDMLLQFEPDIKTTDTILTELLVYANRMEELDTMLSASDEDEKLIRYLLNISNEAGDLPDSLPDHIREIAGYRGSFLGARDRMATGNLRLVVKVASQYRGKGMPFEDLIMHGNVGLMRGVDKYDYKRGYKFSTYVWWWIRQSITRALYDNQRTIRLPVHVIERLSAIRKASHILRQDLGREPKPEEIAEHAGLELSYVMQYTSIPGMLHYDRPVESGSEDAMLDFIPDEDTDSPERAAQKNDIKGLVAEVLDNDFTPREADIIRRRYGIGPYEGNKQTLEQVGKVHKVTRERIRQLGERVKEGLLHASRAGRLAKAIDLPEGELEKYEIRY